MFDLKGNQHHGYHLVMCIVTAQSIIKALKVTAVHIFPAGGASDHRKILKFVLGLFCMHIVCNSMITCKHNNP